MTTLVMVIFAISVKPIREFLQIEESVKGPLMAPFAVGIRLKVVG